MEMLKRELDIVILGCTGFTGSRVLAYLRGRADSTSLKIGAAGRSRSKVESILKGDEAVQALVVDVTKPAELLKLAAKTRLVLNCVGPFRYSGEAVVRACIESGTDYLDVSGEPEFIESAEFRFKEKAKERGCFVASACGFDSIPADFGTLYVQQLFSRPGIPSSVESFLTLHSSGPMRFNFATWESAVHGFASADSLKTLRKQARASGTQPPAPKYTGPRHQPLAGTVYDSRVNSYAMPFPGSDASVVRRTQRALSSHGQDPVQYAACFCVSSRWTLLLLAVFGLALKLLAPFRLGRYLLLSFPEFFTYGVFSKRTPSQKQLESTTFSMLFIGRGYTGSSADAAASGALPNREVRVKVLGPEPGYVATPIFLVTAALTLLQEREKVKQQLGPGGVFTAGTLLGRTSYVERLQAAGIGFQMINDLSLS